MGPGRGEGGGTKKKESLESRVDTDTYQQHESEAVRNKWNSTYQSLNHRSVRLSFGHKPRKCWTSPLPLTQPYRNRRGGGCDLISWTPPSTSSPPPTPTHVPRPLSPRQNKTTVSLASRHQGVDHKGSFVRVTERRDQFKWEGTKGFSHLPSAAGKEKLQRVVGTVWIFHESWLRKP